MTETPATTSEFAVEMPESEGETAVEGADPGVE